MGCMCPIPGTRYRVHPVRGISWGTPWSFHFFPVPLSSFLSLIRPWDLMGYPMEFPFFSRAIIFFLILLPPSRTYNNSDPGSHGTLFSHPSLLRRWYQVRTCLAIISRQGFSNFFPRRLASNRVYPRYNRRSRQLVSLLRNKTPYVRTGWFK